jgi:hypothetical protein
MAEHRTDDEMAAAKAKMRAALDRKKEQDHLTAEGRRNTGIQGSEVTGAEGKRVFRRKSG